MNTPVQVIQAVAGIGGKLSIAGDKIRMLLPADCPPELKDAVRLHKPALIELLRHQELGLTPPESTLLRECEAVIAKGLETFVEVGSALLTISERRLYRETHDTFELYCRERWKMERAHAYRLIESAQVVKNLSPIGDILPANESQARPLAVLEPEEQRAAWQRVLASSPNGNITAKQVVEAARIIKAEKGEQRRIERLDRIATIAAGNTPLPTARRYPVILADPPWPYEHHSTAPSGGVENHYPTMSIDDICRMPVSELATPDAILFLWVTFPKLAEAMQVVEAWGFVHRTAFVWVKNRIGTGHYVRGKAELLLVATRGDLPTPSPENRPVNVIEAPRGRHSEKPGEVYEIVERMYPGLPRIELFARQQRDGWQAWGNEA